MEDPTILRAKLDQLRRLLRLAMLSVGLGKVVCVVGAVILLDFVLDRALRLPWEARVSILSFSGALLLWQCARHVIRPLTRLLSDGDLALELERRQEGADDLFASALQFATGAGGVAASAALQAEVARQGDRRAAQITPVQLVRWRRVKRWVAAAAAAGGLFLTLVLLEPEVGGLWLRRNVLLADEDWPRRTQLSLTECPDSVPRGASMHVTVKAAGVVPLTARLQLRGAESGVVESLTMERVGGSSFRAELDGLDETSVLAVRAGDGFLPEHRIEVVDRPSVAAARMVIQAPEYIAREPIEMAWNAPGFRVPRGSEATVTLQATKPLSAGFCQLDEGDRLPMERTAADTVRFRFAVHRDVRCAFTLVDTLGIEGEGPLLTTVQAVEDRAPDVDLTAQGIGDMLAAAARVPLAVEASDDYGAESVWLEVLHEAQEGRQEHPDVKLWEGSPRRSVSTVHVVQLGEHDLPPKGRLVVTAVARDNSALDGPNSGQSAPLLFRIVTVHELLDALLLQQQDLRRDLEQQMQRQRDLKRWLVQAGPSGDDAYDEVQRAERDLAGVLERTAAGYHDVLAQMLNNGVIPQPTYEARVADIVQPLERLGTGGGILFQLADGIQDVRRGAGAKSDVVGLMDATLGEMKSVRARMLLLEDYASLAASVEEAASEQRELLARTQEQGERKLDFFRSE
ncbi:MAG: hypothetical protein ACYTFZ_00665 [Planctomycetota bacterium]